MRVGLATVQVPFVRGGAESLAESLQAALEHAGHEAEIVSIPFKWYGEQTLSDAMLAARLIQVEDEAGPRIDRLIGLKFPAYYMRHRSKRAWLLHQHRSAYELWESPISDLAHMPGGAHLRSAIHAADNALLAECQPIYTISRGVSERLRRFNGLVSEPLYHPPPGVEHLRPGDYGDYILFPSRLNEGKRQSLVLDALSLTREPVRVCFMGAADAPDYERRLRARCSALCLDERVQWRGRVSEAEKLALYAGCLAVVFPPLDEDYGYVTLEAMVCSKAVLTTADAGGPLDFIADGENGLVCPPQPAAMAAALDRVWGDRAQARAWGQAARACYADMRLSWTHVVRHLLA